MQILRGAAAALGATMAMAVLAVAALATAGLPVTWPFVATVLAAAFGGPATLTGSLDAGAMGAVLHGTVDIAPLALSAVGALIFSVTLQGHVGTPMPVYARRVLGAAAMLLIVLAAVVAAPDATMAVTVPAGPASASQDAQLVIRPDTGATLISGLLGFTVLTGGGALLTLLPHRRIAARAALTGLATPIAAGVAIAAVVATQRPSLAGVALLFGGNAAMLAGPSSITLGGPLADRLDPNYQLPDAAAGALAVPLILAAFVLATVPPGDGNRWQRAGRRALVAGAVLAVVFAALSLAGAGRLSLGLMVLILNAELLTVQLVPAIGWAALAGAAGGGLAGLLGSLMADMRRTGGGDRASHAAPAVGGR
ncbi:hypothetical protein OHA21_06250 [Actinoplanes sp. NBC_00393]|uniref:hypothetical protein n=1 Tax=Actinoplanes sp. NBC_00393 TaxID=2975953 RepID=UPI002E227F86